MKLKFKQQPYQADATMAVIHCFEGQGKGIRKEIVGRDILDNGLFGAELTRVEEIFSNKKLEITDTDILWNVQTIQKEQGLKTSSRLDGLNFTIEMETGERVIIVMGAVNVMKPRVSGTLNKYILCIA